MNLRIMTFNLRYDESKDGENAWPYRIGRASEIVLENDPDVLGVQEALYPMLLDLSSKLVGYDWFGIGRLGGNESEHCAVFYKKNRLVPKEKGQFWLSETPEETASISWDSSCPRTCTWINFMDRLTGQHFLVYNTHLDHKGAIAREKGAELIFSRMRKYRSQYDQLPAFLMGDMNCIPTDAPIRFLRGENHAYDRISNLHDAFTGAEQPIGTTFHGFRGITEGEPIDYIFATPEVAFQAVKVDRTRYPDGYPSDHYPVVADAVLRTFG